MQSVARCLAWTTVVVATTVSPRAAFAQASPQRLAEAEALLEDQDFEAARALLRQALERGGLDEQQLADVFRGLAECGAALREPQESRDAFVRLLALDRDFTLPELASPLLREPFDAAAAFWEGQPRPTLRVDLPERVVEGEPFVVVATMEASALPGFSDQAALLLRGPGGSYREILGDDGRIEVPPELLEGASEVALYVVMRDQHGNVVASEGAADDPVRIFVDGGRRSDRGRTRAAGSAAPWYRRWWVWTIVGAGVVGLATGLSLGLTLGTDGGGDPCEQALGQACDQTVTFR